MYCLIPMYDIVQNSISKFLCYFMSKETPAAMYTSFQAKSLSLSLCGSMCVFCKRLGGVSHVSGRLTHTVAGTKNLAGSI